MSMFRKVLTATAVALIALTFVPSHLGAEEREARTEVRVSASVLGWFSELAAWFAGDVVPPRARIGVVTSRWCGAASAYRSDH